MSIDFRDRIDVLPFDFGLDRTTAVVTIMLLLDAIWWIATYHGYAPVPGMGGLMERQIPMTAPGAMELTVFNVGTLGAFLGYLAMWGMMMWAMMYPAMTRFTREYAAALRGSTSSVAKTIVAFLAAYGAVWVLSGVIPLLTNAVVPGGIYGFTKAYTHFAIGGVLILTGFYQLTSFKQTRLRTCCARVTPHDAHILDGLREGLSHGVSCVLVCFGPFFLLMPFFGEMNLFWMVVLTTVVTVERLPARWGSEFAIASGIMSLIAGLVILLAQPPLPVGFVV